MARTCFSLFLSVCLIATVFVFSSFPVSAEEILSANNDSSVTLEQANQVLQSSSNFFTENKGQWPEEILFVGNTDFGKVAFTQEAVYYQLVKRFDEFTSPPVIESQTIKLSFVNAQTPTIQGKTLLPHYNNYLSGNDPEHWGIHCNNYTQVSYTNVWDNIDLSYFFTPQGMKYRYYVHPGADIQDVQVQVVGADLLSNEQSLELCTLLGNLKDDHLFVYGQDSLSTLESSFQVQNDIFSFDVKNNLSTDETIVIDPLVYSTYLGGTSPDYGYSIAVDEGGNAYVTGITYSIDFPMDQIIGGALAPGYDKTSNGNRDAFVVKLDLPKPILDITAITNASSYTEGTQPILTITLANIGDEYAHSCEVLVTLPPQLQFLDDQLIASTPAPNNSQLFQAGGIPTGGSIAFPVFIEVIENVPADTTVTVSFDASCAEHATANTHLYIDLLHIDTTPPCPSLFLETTPNKPNYYYGDLVYLNVTLRNLGGQATGVKLELDLPPALSYAGCDNYRAVGQGQHQTFTIGTMEPDSVLRFVIYAHVNTDVKVAKSIPILLELTANECDSLARRLVNIKLEPKRTGQQNLDLSVKLLNLEFDEDTGKYYLPYDQTLELQLQVSGYETYYNYTIHWGDGETTTLKNETSATILLKHKFTAKGTMHLKITIQDPNGREKTSTLYVTVR